MFNIYHQSAQDTHVETLWELPKTDPQTTEAAETAGLDVWLSKAARQQAVTRKEQKCRPGSWAPSPAAEWPAGNRGREGSSSCSASAPARDCPGAGATRGPAPQSGWPAGCSRCQKQRLGLQQGDDAQLQTLWPRQSEKYPGGLKLGVRTNPPKAQYTERPWML